MPDLLGKPPTAAPSTHGLVIGVSRYAHLDDGAAPTPGGQALGLTQLSSAARSASLVADWLRTEYHNPRAPLASLRVLLSPSKGEAIAPGIAALLPAAYAADSAAVRQELGAFRAACDANPGNVGFVYVAGHGVQITKDGAIVLLEDVGSSAHLNALDGAIDMAGCHAGMNHPATAQTQFWFVDACRQRPEIAKKFETLTGGIALDVRKGVAGSSPLFLSSSTEQLALAHTRHESLFCEVLLEALRGGAIQGPSPNCPAWHVSVYTLNETLVRRVRDLAGRYGEEQDVDLAGRPAPAVVQRYALAPSVALHVELHPSEAEPVAMADLLLDAQTPVLSNHRVWPLSRPFPAGLYLLKVRAPTPYHDAERIVDLKPPRVERDVEVL